MAVAPDLVAAAVDWLRVDPVIVEAFGDTPETPKFWSDYEALSGSDGNFPYLVFLEPSTSETYETRAQNGTAGGVVEGTIRIDVYSGVKTTSKELSGMVASSLRDAALEFAWGNLIYFRPYIWVSPVITEVGPQGSPTAFKETVTFHFFIESDFPLILT